MVSLGVRGSYRYTLTNDEMVLHRLQEETEYCTKRGGQCKRKEEVKYIYGVQVDLVYENQDR